MECLEDFEVYKSLWNTTSEDSVLFGLFTLSLLTASRINEPSSKSFCSSLCGSVWHLSPPLKRPLLSDNTQSFPWLLLFFKQFVQCLVVCGHFRWILCVFCLHFAFRRRVSPTWRTNSSISAVETVLSFGFPDTTSRICSTDGIVADVNRVF